MSSVANFIRKKMKTKKEKLKDEMLDLQAKEIAQLSETLSQVQQSKAELLRVQDESDKRFVDLMVAWEKETEKFLLEKTQLERRMLELGFGNQVLKDNVRILEEQNKKMREEVKHRQEQAFTTELTLSRCRDQIHELKESIQNTVPEPKQISMPTCQICLYEFSETLRIPRMLTCGHTLCEQCILQIQEGPHLRCPFDRKEQCMGPGGVAGLPKNFAIVEVMEGKKEDSRRRNSMLKMCFELKWPRSTDENMVSRLEMNAKLAQKDEKIAHLEWELEKIKKSSATMRQAEKELREELERTVSAQKLMLQISRSGGAPSAFRLPFCEICGFEFDDFPGRIPRLLKCGHSVCEQCVQKPAKKDTITCPFDRSTTQYSGKPFDLPKNFGVLGVIEINMSTRKQDSEAAIEALADFLS